MSNLKPCPFCFDSEVEVYKRKGGYERGDGYYVHCHDCGLEFPGDHTFRKKERAVEAWNTRANEDKRKE